ncbi:hypothetical protein [Nocardioides sp.]|uniref:hypothetical protein n=1 Tax=Nocardioides sp. TaxID=35761 RepID=UPI0026086F79|nr:hypothetical protein [Nocardioides sp.]MDI6911510.1 hypothetical protein [Nocardioides sp.]
MPNQPATPNRTLRIPDEIWQEARRIAADRGENVTAVVIRALERYIRQFGDDHNGDG